MKKKIMACILMVGLVVSTCTTVACAKSHKDKNTEVQSDIDWTASAKQVLNSDEEFERQIGYLQENYAGCNTVEDDTKYTDEEYIEMVEESGVPVAASLIKAIREKYDIPVEELMSETDSIIYLVEGTPLAEADGTVLIRILTGCDEKEAIEIMNLADSYNM